MKQINVVTIIGARPQFIKASAISRAIAKWNKNRKSNLIREVILHTGQHYDDSMSRVFFDDLNLPHPDHNLGIGSGTHGAQTGQMLIAIEVLLLKERPDLVLVYGDTNSTLAGALAAAKLHIPLAHVEAGLRSFNKKMPEEINRILTDHMSSILFCPTKTAVKNLKQEGFLHIANNGKLITSSHMRYPGTPAIFNVGDVMYDTVLYNLERAKVRSRILDQLGITPGAYSLATLHRAENTDDPRVLRGIFRALDEVAASRPLILPLHPRMKNRVPPLRHRSGIKIISPLPYHDMLMLSSAARVILTDSGGLQKEAYFLNAPCVTLRNETEWLETVKNGRNIIAGTTPKRIMTAFHIQEAKKKSIGKIGLFGDGHASDTIVNILARI
jgi:UDP-GlcNAc3NAcA epimerase